MPEYYWIKQPIRADEGKNKMPVFVGVAERMERPKPRNVKRKIYAPGIWLQAFDHCLDSWRNSLQFLLACRSLPITPFIDDRECIVRSRFLSIGENQLPDKMIKRRS